MTRKGSAIPAHLMRERVCLDVKKIFETDPFSEKNKLRKQPMIKVLKVYRYRNSGKLIASGLSDGGVFALNSDLTFSSKAPYRVRWSTELDKTPYRIEVEVVKFDNKYDTYRIIRTWNEENLSPKSTDPNASLEYRIDISPSQEFTSAEAQYVRQPNGNPAGKILILASLILLGFVGTWGWWPPFLTFVTGVIVAIKTTPPSDPHKLREVWDAKERLRESAKSLLESAMRDIRVWAELDGIGFERAVAKIYREEGYEVEFTPRTNDQGVDLILKNDTGVTIVQCKAYTKNVGVSAVRELAGIRNAWPNATGFILVTLFDFSTAAKTFAAKHNIKLFSVAKDYLKTDYRPNR